MSPDEPGVIKPLKDGWHDTGDVVSIDDHGYVAIRGRLKRFAKIGGEMVSLAVVENCASAVWPENMHAAAILPDAKKGEQIVLVTDRQDAPRGLLLSWAQSHGVPEIAVPKKIVNTAEIPVLGTGKVDYVRVKEIAETYLAEQERKATETAETEALTKKEVKKRAALEKAERKKRDKARAAASAAAVSPASGAPIDSVAASVANDDATPTQKDAAE